jgi:hypothetical protein
LADAGYPVPPLFNPADHLLDIVSNPDRTRKITDFWDSRKEKLSLRGESKEYDPINAEVLASTSRQAPTLVAFTVVLRRMVKNLWRQQPGKSVHSSLAEGNTQHPACFP